jgi:hypothetical protein
MTTPDAINQDLNGTTNGVPNWWDYVLGRDDQVAQQLVNDPRRGPWNNASAPAQLATPNGTIDGNLGTFNHLDHSVLSAEAVSWRYWDSLGNHVDLPTILMVFAEWLIATNPQAYTKALTEARQSHSPAADVLDVDYVEVPDRLQLAVEARRKVLETRRQLALQEQTGRS